MGAADEGNHHAQQSGGEGHSEVSPVLAGRWDSWLIIKPPTSYSYLLPPSRTPTPTPYLAGEGGKLEGGGLEVENISMVPGDHYNVSTLR